MTCPGPASRRPATARASKPAAACILAVAVLAGCGSDDEPPASTPAPAAAAGADVEAAMARAPGPATYSARCGDAGCVRAWRAWAARAKNRSRVCTELYGGPETARVTGTVGGEPVNVTVTRTNGCGIADYEDLFRLLGSDPPVARTGP